MVSIFKLQTAEELRAAQAERLAFLEAERDAHLTTHTQIVGPLNETIVTQRMALDDLERRALAADEQIAQLNAACMYKKYYIDLFLMKSNCVFLFCFVLMNEQRSTSRSRCVARKSGSGTATPSTT